MLYTQTTTANLHEQTFAYLIVEEKNHVLHITLNRAEKKNAMNPTLVNELAYALSYAHHHNHIWTVVLAAKGTVFCAGADLKAFSGASDENNSTIPEPPQVVVIGDLFRHLHKPCIAKVHAPVYAGGFLLICGCTHVIATKNTFYSLPEVKRGLYPMQVMQSLLNIIPPRKVLDWCMRAQSVDAQEAYELGLVTQLVDDEAALNQAVDLLVKDIKQYAPAAIRLGLKAFDELQSKTQAEAHPFLQSMLMEVLQTKDAMEGILAFRQKRQAVWKGE